MKVPPRQRVKPNVSHQRMKARPPPPRGRLKKHDIDRLTLMYQSRNIGSCRHDRERSALSKADTDFMSTRESEHNEKLEPDFTRTDVYLQNNSGNYQEFASPELNHQENSRYSSPSDDTGRYRDKPDEKESSSAVRSQPQDPRDTDDSRSDRRTPSSSARQHKPSSPGQQQYEPFSGQVAYDVNGWTESFQRYHEFYQDSTNNSQRYDPQSGWYGDEQYSAGSSYAQDPQVYQWHDRYGVNTNRHHQHQLNQSSYSRPAVRPNGSLIGPILNGPRRRALLPAPPLYARPGPQRGNTSTMVSEQPNNPVNILLNLSKALVQLDELRSQPDSIDRYTREELILLYKKALAFTTKRTSKKAPDVCHFLYRDKTSQYYANIHQNRGGIMEKYAKDYHGDPKSPINGRLHGLFFNVVVDPGTKRPPNTSLFGERRLHVTVQSLFHQFVNMYFTDFYCTSRCHYVTLVLTSPGSDSDLFCQETLIQLNAEDNPFFQVQLSELGEPMTGLMRHRPVVEVFVTEDIDIQHEIHGGGYFQTVDMVGLRMGGTVGIPKNRSCSSCNLDVDD